MDNEHVPMIEVENVFYRYEKEFILENIHLKINKGSFLGIVGPNGSGKSTLLKVILGLLKPQKGEVRLFGKSIQEFNEWEKVGFVSQKANSFNTAFPATVYEVVASGLTNKKSLFRPKRGFDEMIKKALEAVEITDLMNKNIGELSGGQQQRTFIARAIVSNPELLILDEPTVGVDSQRVHSFYQLLEKLNKVHGMTLLLVTHDVGTITNKVTEVACINKQLFFHGNIQQYEKFIKNDLSSFYGHDVQMIDHNHHHHEHGGREQ